ncbi:Polyketide cyclase / dehydrase and lipid transport [Anatilimnocola aggregata]|uniref:Polyketide cyclase / dehydrase and lipid transport n=1 Tax=Anatilimnocola aggregata TaxID=2528021 RepID=A0A517YKS5_9BACT|nr:SRPBCC family protein [Anatilimnocola aggregata]QDU30826.1 Polyketide cyclase / dehydrase and lipid transport [Anatilimnocola aggregata]
MVKKIVIVVGTLLLVVVLGFLAIVAMQPSTYTVTRTAKMQAPPEVVFAQVNNFQNWKAWSPWEKLDPEMKRTFAGPEAGTGAKYGWNGSDKVGEGSMTITDSQPHEKILIKLEFKRPMVADCPTEFKFSPDGNGTEVAWTMRGENDFMGKAFCLLMNMDKMIGGDFEKGLASMQEIVEKSPAPATESPAPESSAPSDPAKSAND